MNHTEAAQYIKATLTAFGPGEAISMTKETWAKIHEAMRVLAQPEQEPVAWETFALKFANGKGLSYEKPKNLPKYLACRPLIYAPVPTSDTSEKRVDEMAKQLHEPEQEPQYAGTARELFTNAAIERLDVRPSTKVYLGTPSVCEQPAHQEPVWDASAPMVVHPHPAFQATQPQSEQSQVEETLRYEIDALEAKLAECRAHQQEPVIDKSAAIRIATSLGWTPQRTWVELTGFEQKELMAMSARDAVFATEAKLKEKNS